MVTGIGGDVASQIKAAGDASVAAQGAQTIAGIYNTTNANLAAAQGQEGITVAQAFRRALESSVSR